MKSAIAGLVAVALIGAGRAAELRSETVATIPQWISSLLLVGACVWVVASLVAVPLFFLFPGERNRLFEKRRLFVIAAYFTALSSLGGVFAIGVGEAVFFIPAEWGHMNEGQFQATRGTTATLFAGGMVTFLIWVFLDHEKLRKRVIELSSTVATHEAKEKIRRIFLRSELETEAFGIESKICKLREVERHRHLREDEEHELTMLIRLRDCVQETLESRFSKVED